MLNEEKKILDNSTFLNTRKNDREIDKYNRSKHLFFALSIFLCLVLIATTYLLSKTSNIKAISVEGNIYLKDEDVVKLSGLSYDDKFVFIPIKKIEKKIKENVIINECEINLDNDNLVHIVIKENKLIGYSFEDGNNVLILANDSRYILDKDNMYLIENVPMICGFSKEDIVLIEKNFESVDYKMINEISEIHYFPDMKYQNNMLIMRDGNYIFTSVYGLNILNKYYDIDSSYGVKDNKCYYFEDISGNAYTSACPWQVSKQDDVIGDSDNIIENYTD